MSGHGVWTVGTVTTTTPQTPTAGEGGQPGRNIGATFQTLPGASFVVGGAAQASDFRARHRFCPKRNG